MGKELLIKRKVLDTLKQCKTLEQGINEIEKMESDYDAKTVVDKLMDMNAAENLCKVSDGTCERISCKECERETLEEIVYSGLKREMGAF